MRLKIKIGKERERKHGVKHGVRRINLVFPNALIKSRLALKIIRSGMEREAEKGKKLAVSPNYVTRDLLKTFYKCLKDVIKQQGHFNLIEAHTRDGTSVVIRF